jgi:hypothetical protein
MALVRIEKVESWSVYKIFEAETLEIALEIAKADRREDWKYSEDDQVDYYLGDANA